MLINYNSWNLYEGFVEGSGRSEKLWLINEETKEIGLFKFTKSEKTYEHTSEKLASELARLLGLKCAKIELGTYKSRIGSMSYLINKIDEILIEGIYLISRNYPSYNPNTMYDNLKEEYYSLEMILNSLSEYKFKDKFLKIVIFDFLIGNSDRHQNNWAVLSDKSNIAICPIYDNGSSLCCYIDEEAIDDFLGKDKVRFESIVKSKSRSRIRINKKTKKEPTHIEVIQYIKEHYYESVFNLIETINLKLNENSIDRIINNYSDKLLSAKRKKLIKMFLLEKIKIMNDIF